MLGAVYRAIRKLPWLRQWIPWVPPGHFYSPIPSLNELPAQLFASGPPRELPAIDLDEPGQLALLEKLKVFYPDQPFQALKTPGHRYYFENGFYSYSDGILLHCLIRHLQPRRIIEVGSGFSTAVMLDTNQQFLEGSVTITCIEPYPRVLESLLTDADRGSVTVLPQRLQDVPLSTFAALTAGDILFIDSTHVSKTGSDVNYALFSVLPSLQPGVFIHFHDIFYPFEYPEAWVREGRAWNEAYALRAFLQYNRSFEIVLFNTFLEQFHEEWFTREMPLCLRDRSGRLRQGQRRPGPEG